MSKRYVIVMTQAQRDATMAALDNMLTSTPADWLPGQHKKAREARERVLAAASYAPLASAIGKLCGCVEAGEEDPARPAAEKVGAWLAAQEARERS